MGYETFYKLEWNFQHWLATNKTLGNEVFLPKDRDFI